MACFAAFMLGPRAAKRQDFTARLVEGPTASGYDGMVLPRPSNVLPQTAFSDGTPLLERSRSFFRAAIPFLPRGNGTHRCCRLDAQQLRTMPQARPEQ